MKRFWYYLEQLSHGALLGGCIGVLVGCTEYVFLSLGNAYFEEFTAAYWDIMVPYVLVGIFVGLCAAVGIRLVLGAPQTLSQHTARLGAVLMACVVLAVLAVWATYQFGTPLLKLVNVLAYLVALVVALVIGIAVSRVLRAVLAWMTSKGTGEYRLRVGIPLFLLAVSALVLLVPFVYLGETRAVQTPALTPPAGRLLAQRPHVVFILIDTLRADHLPIYGYTRQTAPNLTAFAQRSATLTRMYAQASDTRPSVASIFSSLYPIVHKMNHQHDFLSDAIVTLAEVLQGTGYKTFAVSANPNVSPIFGYAQGFDQFRVSTLESPFRMTMLGRVAEDALPHDASDFIFGERLDIVPQAEVLTDVTLRWVAQGEQGPYFIYVQYIDPHAPYTPPAPYDEAFNYRSDPPLRSGGIDPLQLLPQGKDREQVGRILDQYDGEILYNDHHVGRLLEGLKEMGILDNALVIITSDHGEEFFEHGHIGHSKTLYEEVLHVPFMISWPGQLPAGMTYDEAVALVDVMPTLLSLLGIEPPSGVQGLSFAAHLTQQAEAKPERKHFAQLINNRLSQEMVRHRRYKFIRHGYGPQQGLEELYDLQQDPLERINMAQKERTLVTTLKQELEAFNTFVSQFASLTPEERVQKLDKDTERALRALGYIK